MPKTLFFLAPVLAVLPVAEAAAEPGLPPQLVIVSFDGAHDNALWEKSLAMAERTGARFTYFLSCTFLMTRDGAGAAYRAPGHKAGRSNVGFAPDNADIRVRLGHIWQAHRAGHDIGSHGCGHFDGKDWSRADWRNEFSAFRTALAEGWRASGDAGEEPEGWARFAETEIKGFRAPYLSAGPGLVPALKDFGFTYDASLVSKGPVPPVGAAGITRFALPLIPEGPTGRPVIAMDYNLFVRHSMGVENRKDSDTFEARTLDAFRAAYRAQHDGGRIPLQLGFHFVEMNGGAYWRALDRFLTEVCRAPETACVSYREAMDRLADVARPTGSTF
ncbi:polysaccharide deacetylase family protein [Ensifer soli]|uniref:polysaccharide deacetylase n=1 Tax=Ciceribacter sp. sgz301302 TaxID=3342379 RepID=UPI0035B8A28E